MSAQLDEPSQITKPLVWLPLEVLSKVFTQYCTTSVLQNVALTCRAFHQLVIPTLFQSVRANYDSNTADDMRKTVLSLLRRQSFGAHTRHFRLCGPSKYEYQSQFPWAPEYKVDIGLLTAIQQYAPNLDNPLSRSVPVDADWVIYQCFMKPTILVLTLGLLPNLTSLHIQPTEGKMLDDCLRFLNQSMPLQEITLDGRRSITRNGLLRFNGSFLVELRNLPLLCKVRIVALHSELPPSLGTMASYRGTASYTHLEVRKSEIWRLDLEPLIAMTSSLKSLVFEVTGDRHVHDAPRKIEGILGPLKKYQQGSLKMLGLTYNANFEDYMLQNRYWDHFHPALILEHLQHLTSLQHVCLPFQLLEWKAEAERNEGTWIATPGYLPPKLQTLILVGYANHAMYPMGNVLESLILHLQPPNDQKLRLAAPANPRTIVLVTPLDRFLSCDLESLMKIQQLPGTKTLFGTENFAETFEYLEDRNVTEEIQNARGKIGLTGHSNHRGNQWKGITSHLLEELCEIYQVLKQEHGHQVPEGEVCTLALLQELSQASQINDLG